MNDYDVDEDVRAADEASFFFGATTAYSCPRCGLSRRLAEVAVGVRDRSVFVSLPARQAFCMTCWLEYRREGVTP